MVSLKAPAVEHRRNGAAAQAAVTPIATIRRFLDAQYVTPATGRPGVDAIKSALVRVICVRK